MPFFQLFQYRLGSGKRTIGDFSSEHLLHDPMGMMMMVMNYAVGDSDDDDGDDDDDDMTMVLVVVIMNK